MMIRNRENPYHQMKPTILQTPQPHKTSPLTWFMAVFCAILWVIIILLGLAVVIVYLLFRPRSPKFDLASTTLNAAYIDSGAALNADLTILANFTNPNNKVGIFFNSMTLEVYYGATLISTSYIDSFYGNKKESKLVNIHMVSSEVSLPLNDIERLRKQISSDEVKFDIRGTFKTRHDYGRFLHFSYWLHSHCSIAMSGPPNGSLLSKICKTKR